MHTPSSRIVIVDDHLLIRDALCHACVRNENYSVVGEAGSGLEATQVILHQQPDIVILDLHLPDMSGFDVVSQVRASGYTVKFIAMSGYCDDHTVINIDRLGLHGFLDKQSSMIDTLWGALALLREGKTFFSPAYSQTKKAQRSDPHFFTKILSERECMVLSLIGRSLNDSEIATNLGISLRTAQTHRSNILHKLRLENTPKLISFAIDHGFVQSIGKTAARFGPHASFPAPYPLKKFPRRG